MQGDSVQEVWERFAQAREALYGAGPQDPGKIREAYERAGFVATAE